jgi:formate dehydrogenase iron-sulfur subunit
MTAAERVREAPRGSLLELVLEEQASLSAVERFASRHAALYAEPGSLRSPTARYRDLIPTGAPGSGEQLAFEVDLDACSGCKACVTACHGLNGLDDGETWRHVGVLYAEDPMVGRGAPALQTITGACHHCEDPACLAGCPVQAYQKDPISGIVRHLDDQCIGCQYCTLTCPYEVPQYNERLGIVRKCDMCAGRLAVGEAPACVQACPSGAISIRIVAQQGAEAFAERARGDGSVAPRAKLLPTLDGALAPASLTRPTTRYVGAAVSDLRGDASTPRAGFRPADHAVLRPAAAHWPLAVLLIGTELSVGLLGVAVVSSEVGVSAEASTVLVALAWLSALIGQVGSIGHLGRPRFAFRAVLGWRTSWMSREVIAIALYFAALSLALALGLLVALDVAASHPAVAWLQVVERPLGLATTLLGAAAVFCSVMIYVVTGRPSWSLPRTLLRFAGSVVLLGAAGALGVLWMGGAPAAVVVGLLVLVVAAGCAKATIEARLRVRDRASRIAALMRGARLESGVLRPRVVLRAASLAVGACLLAISAALGFAEAPVALVGLLAVAGALACLLAELLERHLFFVAESARGMPGS